MSAPDDSPSGCDAAVIDVGSNSVRLVLYRLEGRALWTVYNEKVLAGLGRDLAVTGRLSPDGIATALTALTRFRALLDASRPGRIFAAATAAVREAEDGRAFRRRVKAETGLALRVLTGGEEARYAALGVLAGAPASRGLVGDLGGASLELTRLVGAEPAPGVTLPLGPFALGDGARFDVARVREAVEHRLAPFAGAFNAHTLSAVGGAWRNLALLHMKMSDYPLGIVHQYELNRRELLSATRFIGQQSRSSLERIEGISRRRVEALPHAAVVLETLVERLDVQRVVMSAYGLREGLLFETLSPDLRARDPLVDGCAALGARQAVAEPLGAALEAWIAPAFGKLARVFGERDPVLLAAACRLAELGAHLHPDHRADLIFDQVLRAPIPGMDHPERVFLACAVFARHTASAALREPRTINRLLTPERLQRARTLGAAIRLGCDLSGRNPELLTRARLDFKTNTVVVEAEEGWTATLLGEQTAKRAATLAGLLERELKMRAIARKSPGILEAAVD
jgi:exopolyphosphatase / guanosine-5'-triphosphate,3'-diphosphate pyrophosphatase